MNTRYFEELHRAENQRAEWQMLDESLRRRTGTSRRRWLSIVLWIFGLV